MVLGCTIACIILSVTLVCFPLLRDMSKMGSRQFDPMALTRGRFLPVESAMPGTTLELIPMEVRCACGAVSTVAALL